MQRDLFSHAYGGYRKGAGRKRIHSKGVAHRVREEVKKKHPLHINFKFKVQIRNKIALKILKRAIVRAQIYGLNIVHYSMQSNHIHLIVEADNNEILTKGMRSLTITFAKGLKAGKVQLERYHLHVLKSVRETKNAVNYVLLNEQRHTKIKKLIVNEYTSVNCYQLAKNLARSEGLSLIWKEIEFQTSKARTWLLTQGLHQQSHTDKKRKDACAFLNQVIRNS